METTENYSYFDFVLDYVSAALIACGPIISSVEYGDLTKVTLETKYRTYLLSATAKPGTKGFLHTWKIRIKEADGSYRLLWSDTSDSVVAVSTSDNSRVWGLGELRHGLFSEAKKVGLRIGELIVKDLEELPIKFGIQGGVTDGANDVNLEFNAHQASRPIVRKLRLGFFFDFFEDLRVRLPGLQVSGPLKTPGKFDHHLVFRLTYSNDVYFLTGVCMTQLEDESKFDDTNWYIDSDVPWVEGRHSLHTKKFRYVRNYRGRQLINELSPYIRDVILENPLKRDSPNQVPAAKALDLPKSGLNRNKVANPVSIEETMIATWDTSSIFSLPPNAKQLRTTPAHIPAEIVAWYEITSDMQKSANNLVSQHLNSRWLTWENRSSERALAGRLVKNWSQAVWHEAYPSFEQVCARYTKQGNFQGEEGVVYSWLGVGAGVIALMTTGFPLILIGSLISAFIAHLYKRAKHIPTFTPAALRNRAANLQIQLESQILLAISTQIETKTSRAYGANPADWKAAVNSKWQPLGPRPVLPDRDLTPREAEDLAAQYLKFFGFDGAVVTRYAKDGGIDVKSKDLVVQVKHQVNPVGVKVVREILGVATSESRRAAVFAKTGYTREAIDFAKGNSVALFVYYPSLKAHSALAEQIMVDGVTAMRT